jgi:hypothetical protein
MVAERTLTDRRLTDSGPVRGTSLQIHVSRLLLGSLVLATASTLALAVAAFMLPPGPPPGAGPGGPPPPPPHSLITFVVLTGLFAVSWVSVVVTFSRDQILRRLRDSAAGDLVSRDEALAMIGAMRDELAQDRRVELAGLEERIREYGDQRETEGYVNGLRAASRPHQGVADVRPLHRVPPTA